MAYTVEWKAKCDACNKEHSNASYTCTSCYNAEILMDGFAGPLGCSNCDAGPFKQIPCSCGAMIKNHLIWPKNPVNQASKSLLGTVAGMVIGLVGIILLIGLGGMFLDAL